MSAPQPIILFTSRVQPAMSSRCWAIKLGPWHARVQAVGTCARATSGTRQNKTRIARLTLLHIMADSIRGKLNPAIHRWMAVKDEFDDLIRGFVGEIEIRQLLHTR